MLFSDHTETLAQVLNQSCDISLLYNLNINVLTWQLIQTFNQNIIWKLKALSQNNSNEPKINLLEYNNVVDIRKVKEKVQQRTQEILSGQYWQ